MSASGARIIGIGQPLAGDDGVGWAVIDALSQERLPPAVELLRLRDPSALPSHLEGRVLLVDALLAPEAPGSVQVIAEADLAAVAASSLSSHGIGVVQAVALARALGRPVDVTFVAIGILPPTRGKTGLSPAVMAAVPRAAREILRWFHGTKRSEP